MESVIVLIVILMIVLFSSGYIIKMKKKGHGCIGCPHSSKCGGNCHSDK